MANSTVNFKTALWQTMHEAAFIIDLYLKIQHLNPASTQLTGYPPHELKNKSLADLDQNYPNENLYRTITSQLFKQHCWQGIIWQRHKKGGIYSCELRIQAYQKALSSTQATSNQEITRYIAILTKEQGEYNLLDPLTGLVNRTYFYFSLFKSHIFAYRNNKHFSLLLVSIDNINYINQQHGHQTGDQFLFNVGRVLETTVRVSDTIARYSGSQFIICLEQISQSKDAGLVAEMVLFKLSQPVYLNKHKVQGEVSIGIVVYPDDNDKTALLLEQVESAVRCAQNLGGEKCYFYNEKLQSQHRPGAS